MRTPEYLRSLSIRDQARAKLLTAISENGPEFHEEMQKAGKLLDESGYLLAGLALRYLVCDLEAELSQ